MSIHSGTAASAPAGTALVLNTSAQKPSIPVFHAYVVGGVITTSINTPIPFNATLINNGGHYNTSTYKFTAPIAGIYHFTGNGLFENGGTSQLAFFKNNVKVTVRSDGFFQLNNDNIPIGMIISLAVNDTFDMRAVQLTAGHLYYGQNLSWFTGHLIG